ncbi:hypothetical protein ACWDD9_20615 [Kitasatospora sp. NPDC001119]
MSAQQVAKALAWIDQAVAEPEQYGTALYVSTDYSGEEAVAPVDIRHALYPLKGRLLDRQFSLRVEEFERSAAEEAQAGDAEGAQGAGGLGQRAGQLVHEQLREERQLQRQRDDFHAEAMRAQISRDNSAHKSALRRSWWSRESVAGTVGAALLAVFGLCIAIGMWFKHDPPQLMGNAFLLVLGYFFGQGAERKSSHQPTEGDN